MIFLVIILIIALILITPVGASIEYFDDLTIRLHISIFKFKINLSKLEKLDELVYRQSKKQTDKKESRKDKQSKKADTGKDKKSFIASKISEKFKHDGIPKTLKFCLTIFKLLAKRAKGFTRHAKITKLQLAISLAGNSPDKIAKEFGQINSVVATGLKVIDQVFKIKKHDIMIRPNFVDKETKIYFYAVLKIRIFFILSNILFLVLDFVKMQLKTNKTEPEKIKIRGK